MLSYYIIACYDISYYMNVDNYYGSGSETALAKCTLVRRHWQNGYLAQQVPSLSLASSSGKCLNLAVPKCTFPWRARYPLG